MAKEMEGFKREKQQREIDLLARQDKQMNEFDRDTNRMGMSAPDVAQAAIDLPDTEDMVSLRGSMISLTTSSSSNSFTSQTQFIHRQNME